MKIDLISLLLTYMASGKTVHFIFELKNLRKQKSQHTFPSELKQFILFYIFFI
jgi:hypothetical protein